MNLFSVYFTNMEFQNVAVVASLILNPIFFFGAVVGVEESHHKISEILCVILLIVIAILDGFFHHIYNIRFPRMSTVPTFLYLFLLPLWIPICIYYGHERKDRSLLSTETGLYITSIFMCVRVIASAVNTEMSMNRQRTDTNTPVYINVTWSSYLTQSLFLSCILVGSLVLNRFLDNNNYDIPYELVPTILYSYSWVSLVISGLYLLASLGPISVSSSESSHIHLTCKGPSPTEKKCLVALNVVTFIVGLYMCIKTNQWPNLLQWFSKSLFICVMLNLIRATFITDIRDIHIRAGNPSTLHEPDNV